MNNEKQSARRKRSATQVGVLEDRTRLLATPVVKDSYEGQIHRVLVFKVSGEHYAVASSSVKEVMPVKSYTTIPGAQAFLRGLFLLRGQFYPLVDTRVILGLSSLPGDGEKSILLLHSEGIAMGWLVDAYEGIQMLRDDELLQEGTISKGLKKEWVSAISPGPLVVLNAVRLMADIRSILSSQSANEKEIISTKHIRDENQNET